MATPPGMNLTLLEQILATTPMQAGEWRKITVPGATSLSSVMVTSQEAAAIQQQYGGADLWGWTGSIALLAAWNSAAFDAANNRMYFFGGGHADYGGNEVLMYDFATLEWVRVTDPAPLLLAENAGQGDTAYSPLVQDGPGAPHTYDGLVWNDVTQSMWLVTTTATFNAPGPLYNPSTNGVWEFDPATGQWTHHAGTPSLHFGQSAVLPTGEVLALGAFASQAWIYQPDGTELQINKTGAVSGSQSNVGNLFQNPVTGQLYQVYPSGIYKLDVIRDAGGTVTNIHTSLISGSPTNLEQAGFAYRSVDGKFYSWQGYSSVVVFDPTNNSFQTIASNGTSPSGQQGTGKIFDKWVYLDQVDLFAGISGADGGGMWFWSPTANSGSTVPTMSVSALNASQPEGDIVDTDFTFQVFRSGDSSGTSTVDYAVTNGTTDAADFASGLPSGSLTFLAGETTKTITVTVAADIQAESNETFTVTLSNASAGSNIGLASATGTIVNDDGVPPPPPSNNSLNVGSLSADPSTAHTISVVLPTQAGDLDKDSSVEIYYREVGTSQWTQSLDLFKTSEGGSSSPFAGMITGLKESTAYEVRIIANDPDGVIGTADQTITVNTSPIPPVVTNPVGNTVTVSTMSQLQAAVNNAGAGDVILLNAGVYNGHLTIQNSNALVDAPIVIRGAPGNASIIDGGGSGTGILVQDSNYIQIEGLTVTNASTGIEIRDWVTSDGTIGNTVRDNIITNVDLGIIAKGNAGYAHQDLYIVNNVVAGNNVFGDTSNATWNDEGIVVAGQGIEIANNTLSGFGDAVGMTHGEANMPNRGIDIHHNMVLWTGDDGVEMDFTDRNAAVHHNMFANAANGISFQYVDKGPAYAFNNIIYNTLRGPYKIKPEADWNDGIYILNNTSIKSGWAWQNDSGRPDGIKILNNLMLGDGTAPDVIRADTTQFTRLELDYNGYNYDSRFQVGNWWNTDFQAWQNSSPFDHNSVMLAGEQIFQSVANDFAQNGFLVYRDPYAADFALAAGSSAIDAGTILPGVTDGFVGAAPDIGALESGVAAPFYGSTLATGFQPVASNDRAAVSPNGTVTIDLLANDFVGGSTSFVVSQIDGIAVSQGATITLSSGAQLTMTAPGVFTYDPNGQFPNLGQSGIATDSFNYTISDGNLTAGATASVDVTSTAVSIGALSADKAEGDSGTTSFTFQVTRSGYLSGASSVDYAVTGGTANAADFASGLPSGIVTFAAGETTKTITVQVSGDGTVEQDETFGVTLSNVSPGTTIATASATGVIRDDDYTGPATLSILASDANKAEGDSGATDFNFTVTRSGDPTTATSVDYTVSGAAVNASDFVGGVFPSGTVNFAAGETSKTLAISVAGDLSVESDEAFAVTLNSPTNGALLGTAHAQGMIRADDAPVIAPIFTNEADAVSGFGLPDAALNLAPVVNAPNVTIAASSNLPLSSLFSVSDANGDNMTQYTLWVAGTSSGTFIVNGVATRGATVTAAQLSNVFWQGGASGSLDRVWLRASDGQDWGDWVGFNVTAGSQGNSAPVVLAPDTTILPGGNVDMSGLFLVSDADGDPITEYGLWVAGSSSGTFVVNGVATRGATIAAADLSNTFWQGGVDGTVDRVWVRANDGNGWSEWEVFNATATMAGNSAPAVMAPNANLALNALVPLSTLFTTIDADGDAITQYDLAVADTLSGWFVVNGVATRAATITAAELPDVFWQAGSTAAVDRLWIRAHDGQDWGFWKDFDVTMGNLVNAKPVVSAPDAALAPATNIPLSSLFSVSDGDGDSITEYRLWVAATTSGTFVVNGVATRGATVSAADLGNVFWQGGLENTADRVWLQARDGQEWGDWKGFTVSTGSYSNSVPSFIDIDGDGDLDAFIDDGTGMISFMRNTGTPSNPVFAAEGHDQFGLTVNPPAGSEYLYGTPGFADIDGDGDFDAFIGERGGQYHFFRNDGTAAVPSFTEDSAGLPGLAYIGDKTPPTFADIDGDGDFDAFVGEDDGTISFFRNNGTATAPAFAFEGPPAPFGLTMPTGGLSALSLVDVDGDGDLDAFMSQRSGGTSFFRNTGTSTSPMFVPDNSLSPLGALDTSKISFVNFVDIDGDGDLDAFLGEAMGNVSFMRNDSPVIEYAITPDASASAPEGDAPAQGFGFTVSRTGSIGTTGTVDYVVTSSSADATDFTGGVLPSGTVTFAPGEASKTLLIDVAGDLAIESDEAFTVTLSNPSPGGTINPNNAAGVIMNDDFPTQVAIGPANIAAVEGDTGTVDYVFTVTRTGDLTGTTSGTWQVGGADVDTVDFGGTLPSGAWSFAPGETVATITVSVTGDTVYEADEDFTVTLQAGTPAKLLVAQATGTIQNDESNPPLTGTSGADVLDASGRTAGTVIDGLGGNDTMTGSSHDDVLTGGAGNDVMDGGDGADDYLFSGTSSGTDTITDTGTDGATDRMVATADGTVFDVPLFFGPNSGLEEITADGHANVGIKGTAFGDLLDFSGITLTGISYIDGGAGDDNIVGSAGDDVLVDSSGFNRFTGGAGNDLFIFTNNNSDFDSVTDFEGGPGAGDVIDLTAYNLSGTFTDFNDFLAQHVVPNVDPNKFEVTLDSNDLIFLTTTNGLLDADDFLF